MSQTLQQLVDGVARADLDVDLDVDALEHPDRYPLTSRVVPRSIYRPALVADAAVPACDRTEQDP